MCRVWPYRSTPHGQGAPPMHHTAMTKARMAALVLGLALAGCDRSPGVAAGDPAASSAVNAAADSPPPDDTVGGTSIVADTTFSNPAQGSQATEVATAEDRLLGNEPTSAGLPTDPPPTAAQEILKDGDRRFLAAASERGAHNLALARLGFDKAKEPEVKLFAERLLTDHQRTQEALQRLASTGGVDIAGPADRLDDVQRLAQASGNEFDARLLELLGIQAQRADIALYEKAVTDAENPAVRAFAQDTLRSLRRHLGAAQELQRAQAMAQTANPMP
ncbi:MAG: DUF4142 domain-containing protein [Rubrivivax sp.]|nr:MAG: DUF4142 domain-containing protein [Rubrivivax sp.]